MLASIKPEDLLVNFSLDSSTLGTRPVNRRYLSDLRGCFNDRPAYETALARQNTLVYEVTAVEPASGDSQLHYGLGILYPGRIGDEYFLTKGHLHSHRPAAEIYLGLKGKGAMVLEDEATGSSQLVPLEANSVVYVPGHTAHRTVNLGDEPLVYLGIYPSNAGHDYGALAKKNFRKIVVLRDGKPSFVDRPAL